MTPVCDRNREPASIEAETRPVKRQPSSRTGAGRTVIAASYPQGMFTGIIRSTGMIAAISPSTAGVRLSVNIPKLRTIGIGESVAINGCCLTVAGIEADGGTLSFDVIPQTLRGTTLGGLNSGDVVNIEPAATGATMLSGHFVLGHVDGVGSARRVRRDGSNEVLLQITPPPELLELVLPKGCIAVDGVSLTVAETGDGCFGVALIPATLVDTNLSRIGESAVAVNLEADYLVKAVVSHLRRSGSTLRG